MYDPTTSLTIIHYFPQLLGFMYFWVFFPFIFQMRGLFGIEGILPIAEYLNSLKGVLGWKRRLYYVPSLFWWNASDRALLAIPILGTILAILLFLGFFPPLLLFLLIILHLSLISAGQDFLSFGWEMFFIEISFNTFFLTLTSSPNLFFWISLNLVLFRFHFEGGISKLLTKDPNWRNMTAVFHHYLSQPLPNTVAYFVHKLPLSFHRLSCFTMFVIEIFVPFGIFLTEEVRSVVFILFFLLQFMIWVTGNFSYLNYLTVVLSTILISDSFLGTVAIPSPTPLAIDLPISLLGGVMILLQLMRLSLHFVRVPLFSALLKPLQTIHIVNRFGIFAVMTLGRKEITIEGSHDQIEWKEYLFKYKPGRVDRRPRRISPYQPRLDWQVWFLPFSSYYFQEWFQAFLYRLLTGSKPVLGLLAHNPFPGSPPRYIRVRLFDYTYTPYKELRTTGHWWKREYYSAYSPILELKS